MEQTNTSTNALAFKSYARRLDRPHWSAILGGTLNLILFLSVFLNMPISSAAIIGTNTPARPLTADRIAALPAAVRPAWEQYRARSDRQLRADQEFLRKEMRARGLAQSLVAPSGYHTRSVPLNRPAVWYGSAEARRIADNIVSYQTPAGGWSKNLDFTKHPRTPGEGFAPDNISLFLAEADYDAPHNTRWNYVGTFDNDATVTQLRFLSKVISAVGPFRSESYRAAFLRGIDYILAAQYPNGGWPQVWPLQGGYHDAITYNDGAMVNILKLLSEVAEAKNEFAFAPAHIRTEATASVQRGIDCILASQIVENGRRTTWCQQVDPLTLLPTSARNYEMPAECGAESAGIVMFLMQLPEPGPAVIRAVRSAVAWFERTKIFGVAYTKTGDKGRTLVAAPGSGPLWARYYEIGTDRPIFGDRDKTIHDDVNEISTERLAGYTWYTDGPKRMLERYAVWNQTDR
jgi:PelA/Pel-15E family pectate lyase